MTNILINDKVTTKHGEGIVTWINENRVTVELKNGEEINVAAKNVHLAYETDLEKLLRR